MKKRHPNFIKIGKRIRTLGKECGYSQEDFADAAQLDRIYVEREEQNISCRVGKVIALIGNCSVNGYNLINPPF